MPEKDEDVDSEIKALQTEIKNIIKRLDENLSMVKEIRTRLKIGKDRLELGGVD